ncbi:hypothetical protein Cfor_03697 [Coptotermes formosanus]|uniref:Uncharacterized protein n=1 Tax=Coptotermes formosanus TaxID=36987 RepID=A0A6L2PYV1_COPFO|nr:hypothetical protein Cfor_03697 [Coptotermes formosanus]
MQCEAVLLGREPVDGAIDAVSLATLIRSLLPPTRNTTTRGWTNTANERHHQRYILRCRDGLELLKRPHRKQQSKRHDDEGFESDGDDDSASTRSLGSSADDTISNSSSCCFVDDHVFKCHPNASTTTTEQPTASSRLISSSTSSCVSSVATDSANSSGASDTEDTSAPSTPSPTTAGTNSVAALVKSLSRFQQRTTATENSKQPPPPPPHPPPTSASKDEHEESREMYSVNEIAFCHTDPSFQRVVVWVVKKRRPHGRCSSGCDTAGGLEALVLECSSDENMKKLIQSFHETSRRFKLEQYRHPQRRKDISAAPSRIQSPKTSSSSTLTPESIIKALKEASQKSPTFTATAMTVPRPIHLPTTTTSSNGSGPGSEVEVLSTVAGTRFNLVQRTDGDGVTHIEVSRGLPTENPVESVVSLDDDQNLGGPSSIISISTPDIGNLLSTNDNVGNKTRFCKEIEGVIRSDVDVGGSRKEVIQRQRQPAILVLHSGNGGDDSGGELRKVWSPPTSTTLPQDSIEKSENNTHLSVPPQRPERRRYARKNKAPAPQPPSLLSQTTKGSHQLESVTNKILPFTVNKLDTHTNVITQKRISSSNNSNQQLVVKGQFIRVSVDQQQQQPTMVVPALQQGTWIYGNNVSNGNLIAYSPAPTSWAIPVTASLKPGSNKNHAKNKDAEDSLANSSSTSKHQQPQTQQHYRKNRSRSRNVINGSHRSKSPPARRPMAYRYIDTVPASNTANFLSNRFFGLSQKLREIGGAVVNSSSSLPYIETARRRNSIGDLPARFECLGEGCAGGTEGKNGGNLKSVIKKNRRIGEYTEPKKVTFSAYATVQVVD